MTEHQSFLPAIQNHNFTALFRSSSHPRESNRFLAFSHLQEGKSPNEVARIVRVSRNTVYRWIRNFQNEGVAGLREKPGRGKKLLIPYSEHEAFRLAVLELQDGRSGGCIIGKDVLHLMMKKYGVKCSSRYIKTMLI